MAFIHPTGRRHLPDARTGHQHQHHRGEEQDQVLHSTKLHVSVSTRPSAPGTRGLIDVPSGTLYMYRLDIWTRYIGSHYPTEGRNVLELAILGLLKEQTMHGYQLSKRLADTLGGFWKVSYGSLYPTLRRLEREGAVQPVFAKEEVGRRKNVYRITEKGEKLFYELLQEAGQESWEDNRFRVRLAFFKYLKPDTRLRLLEKRRAYLEDRLSVIRASLSKTRERIDAYTESLMKHGADSTEQDIAWLDGLIQSERRKVQATGSGARQNGTNGPTRGGGRRRSSSTFPTKERAR
jgi:DNA-binding PadR family transcriptional regulator